MDKRLLGNLVLVSALSFACLPANSQAISAYITKADRSSLFEKSDSPIEFRSGGGRGNSLDRIIVDPGQTYQKMTGFGFALTGGSAEHLINMTPAERAKILYETFDPEGGIGVSTIRLTVAASDLNSFVFIYDDMREGQEDMELKHFSLGQDYNDVIPVMKEILAINSDIEIIASPWSAPTWMKDNGKAKGGHLRKECYDVYARYFAKYIKAMEAEGIHIDGLTVQNEPLNSNNTPSMVWLPADQAEFVKNYLGPTFEKEKITTGIIVFDHNTDRMDYPLAIYSDPGADKYVKGAAYHNYAGNMSTMSYVHDMRPDKPIYFTEQMTTERPGSKEIAISSSVNRLLIQTTRNWTQDVILWNLAADSHNNPHTDDGGCSMCQGALTIEGNTVEKNIAFWVIAHASKMVRPGSVRIHSTAPGDKLVYLSEDEQMRGSYRANIIDKADVLDNVAFCTPDGKIVLIVANNSLSQRVFQIQYNGLTARVNLPSGAVGTYVWDK